MTDLSTTSGFQMVPAGYAEKAMASLMQLHSELMSEKEKRVDLFRQLMEREQALAELKQHVKMLEAERAAAQKAPVAPVATVTPVPQAAAPAPAPAPVAAKPSPAMTALRQAVVASVAARAPGRVDGWKSW